MPTYDYECETCGHRFELFQSMNDKRLSKCTADICVQKGAKKGKGKVKRLLGTGAGIIFKGSGFYQTDYRSESYKKGAEKASSAEKSASGSEKSGKKDSATKSKSESKPKAGGASAGSNGKKS